MTDYLDIARAALAHVQTCEESEESEESPPRDTLSSHTSLSSQPVHCTTHTLPTLPWRYRDWPEDAKRWAHRLRRELSLGWPEAVRVVAATWPEAVPQDLIRRHRRALADLGPEAAARDLVAEVDFRGTAGGDGWQRVEREPGCDDDRQDGVRWPAYLRRAAGALLDEDDRT